MTAPARRIGIGVLGASTIAPHAVVGPAARREDVDVVRVAAARPGAAVAFADRHGIPRADSDYRSVLDDPAVDLVYVGLAAAAHERWVLEALDAGKHVLCEKPLGIDHRQAIRMTAAAARSDRCLVEAFHYRFHPLFDEVLAFVRSPEAGALRTMASVVQGSVPFDARSVLHDPAVGGGALLHSGCYPVHWMRALAGGEPTVIRATAESNPLGADVAVSAELAFPGGVRGRLHASFTGGTSSAPTLTVETEHARLEVDGLIAPHQGHSLRVRLPNGVETVRTVGGLASYDHQLEAVLRAVRGDRAAVAEELGPVGNMAAIDAISRAAGTRAA